MAFVVAPPLPPPPAAGGWRRRPWAAPRRPHPRSACSRDGDPGPPTFGRLREQLLQLHAEADLTQSKANSARARLVRLTEAAENLKKRAANSVRVGKESEAVDLLVQKKKLTRSLESIKERIEVLDKLSAKISETISLKQNMLIQCALRPETPNGENSDDKIRIFSGKVDDGANVTESVSSHNFNDGADGTESSGPHPNSVEKNFSEMRNEAHADIAGHPKQRELQIVDNFTCLIKRDPANGVMDPSTYDDFLKHIDMRLKSLENETEHFLSSKQVEEVDNGKQTNEKWHRLSEILKLVKETRGRVVRILDTTAEENETQDLR